jgi:hypothetical protein
LLFRVVVGFCTGIELWRWASIGCENKATSPLSIINIPSKKNPTTSTRKMEYERRNNEPKSIHKTERVYVPSKCS